MKIKASNIKTGFMLLFMMYSSLLNAQEITQIHILNSNLFHYHYSSNTKTQKLLIFLHGSVITFKDKSQSDAVDMTLLLENNQDFIASFTAHQYDVILPISFNQYNWLEDSGAIYLDSLLSRYSREYNSIFIAGFSDGATGAYQYFYRNPGLFSGLMVFNGYPQYKNFYKKVDYHEVTDQKVIFISQASDKVIPYEFLLREYRRQKMLNNNSYFMLKPGKHQFSSYTARDFEECIDLLESKNQNLKTEGDSFWVYPPIDGLIVRDTIKALYDFRPKIAKRYGMNKNEYLKLDKKAVLKEGSQILPLKVDSAELQNKDFTFIIKNNGMESGIKILNYVEQRTW